MYYVDQQWVNVLLIYNRVETKEITLSYTIQKLDNTKLRWKIQYYLQALHIRSNLLYREFYCQIQMYIKRKISSI